MQQYHFAAVDCYGWACSESMENAIANRDEDSGQQKIMNVYFVPLPDKGSEYQFAFFRPQVQGAFVVRERDAKGNWTDRNQEEQQAAVARLHITPIN